MRKQSILEDPTYSVVIPVYNSDRSLTELVERLARVFSDELEASYEVILIDDGSRSPTTWKTCERLAAQYATVVAIRLMRNYGKPGAVLCGLQHVRGRYVVTIDDDLQQRPEDIPELVLHKEHDVVVASFKQRNRGLVAVVGSWLKQKFDRLILGLPCKMTPLKLFKAEVARGMLQIRTPYPFIPALLSHVTTDIVTVAVRHEASRHGASRYTLGRRLRQVSNLMISNSSILLRGLGLLGAGVAVVGFAYACQVVVRRWLWGEAILAGWSSLIVINLVFGGFILIALGIVGEYLLRILDGISEKPPYLVREVAAKAAAETAIRDLEAR